MKKTLKAQYKHEVYADRKISRQPTSLVSATIKFLLMLTPHQPLCGGATKDCGCLATASDILTDQRDG